MVYAVMLDVNYGGNLLILLYNLKSELSVLRPWLVHLDTFYSSSSRNIPFLVSRLWDFLLHLCHLIITWWRSILFNNNTALRENRFMWLKGIVLISSFLEQPSFLPAMFQSEIPIHGTQNFTPPFVYVNKSSTTKGYRTLR